MTVTEFRSRTANRKTVAIDSRCLVFTVWGPPGSTGKSSLSLNLAYEFSLLGKRVLLLDLDTTAPALAQLLGIKEVPAGLSAVARLIRQGRFNPEQLERLSVVLKHKKTSFNFLPGLASATRWSEVSPETVSQILETAKQVFDVIICDVSSHLEEKLFNSQHAISRNAVTRSAAHLADSVICVVRGTEIGLARYLSCFSIITELQKTRALVINISEPNSKLTAAIQALTKEKVFGFIPSDVSAFELAEATGLPLALVRRKSSARNAIAALAHKLLQWPHSVS